jgi:rRNA-processing protein FCF1
LLVLLDTSILIFLVETPSTFLDELRAKMGDVEFSVPDSVIGELKGLAGSRGVKARKAKLALSYATGLKSMKHGGEADDALVSLAQENGAVVATLDKSLVSSLRRRGVMVATVKGHRLLLAGTG